MLELNYYCTISIDSAWGVTCDLEMNNIPTTSNVGVTWGKL